MEEEEREETCERKKGINEGRKEGRKEGRHNSPPKGYPVL